MDNEPKNVTELVDRKFREIADKVRADYFARKKAEKEKQAAILGAVNAPEDGSSGVDVSTGSADASVASNQAGAIAAKSEDQLKSADSKKAKSKKRSTKPKTPKAPKVPKASKAPKASGVPNYSVTTKSTDSKNVVDNSPVIGRDEIEDEWKAGEAALENARMAKAKRLADEAEKEALVAEVDKGNKADKKRPLDDIRISPEDRVYGASVVDDAVETAKRAEAEREIGRAKRESDGAEQEFLKKEDEMKKHKSLFKTLFRKNFELVLAEQELEDLRKDFEEKKKRYEELVSESTSDADPSEEEIEAMPTEKKEKLWRGFKNVGFFVEQRKNSLFAKVTGGLVGLKKEEHIADKGMMSRIMYSLSQGFEEKAKKAKDNMEGKGILNAASNAGFLSGNLIKYGRLISDLMPGSHLASPMRYVMMGAMAMSESANAFKEARLSSAEAVDKTRINDFSLAEEEAWKLYEEAQRGDKDRILTREEIEKHYQKGIPKDVLERLKSRRAYGDEGLGLVEFVVGRDVKNLTDKIAKKVEKIEKNKKLSDEEKERAKDKIIAKYSDYLKMFERLVSQAGEVDALAMMGQYVKTGTKAAVYAVSFETIALTAEKLVEFSASFFQGSEEITKSINDIIEKAESGTKPYSPTSVDVNNIASVESAENSLRAYEGLEEMNGEELNDKSMVSGAKGEVVTDYDGGNHPINPKSDVVEKNLATEPRVGQGGSDANEVPSIPAEEIPDGMADDVAKPAAATDISKEIAGVVSVENGKGIFTIGSGSSVEGSIKEFLLLNRDKFTDGKMGWNENKFISEDDWANRRAHLIAQEFAQANKGYNIDKVSAGSKMILNFSNPADIRLEELNNNTLASESSSVSEVASQNNDAKEAVRKIAEDYKAEAAVSQSTSSADKDLDMFAPPKGFEGDEVAPGAVAAETIESVSEDSEYESFVEDWSESAHKVFADREMIYAEHPEFSGLSDKQISDTISEWESALNRGGGTVSYGMFERLQHLKVLQNNFVEMYAKAFYRFVDYKNLPDREILNANAKEYISGHKQDRMVKIFESFKKVLSPEEARKANLDPKANETVVGWSRRVVSYMMKRDAMQK